METGVELGNYFIRHILGNIMLYSSVSGANYYSQWEDTVFYMTVSTVQLLY